MRINFQNDIQPKTEQSGTTAGKLPGFTDIEKTRNIGSAGVIMDIKQNTAHGFKGVAPDTKKNTAKSIGEDAALYDAKNAHNYMAVMSNTMSEKDFQKMSEEGFHPGKMTGAETVTGLDRIKVILAESGVDVAGFTDTVDRDTAAEITGSITAANRITGGNTKEMEMTVSPRAAEIPAESLMAENEPMAGRVPVFEPKADKTAAAAEPKADKTAAAAEPKADKTAAAAEHAVKTAAPDVIPAEISVSDLLKGDETEIKAQISESLKLKDLPDTDANIKEVMSAFRMAADLEPLDTGTIEYMMTDLKEPTIENVYFAEHSGAGKGSGGAGGYFSSEASGYYAEAADTKDLQGIREQIAGIIERSGYDPSDSMREDAEYLIKNGIALTKETLDLYEDIKSISFPLKAADILSEAAETISRGKSGISAALIRGYNRIRNERVLNETRLEMNTEANRSIRSDNGFALETEELSEKVDLLRSKERAFYRAAFMRKGGENPLSVEESVSLAEETLSKVSKIKEMPAALAGRFSSAETFTVNDVYEAGAEFKKKYEDMNVTYEAVGTAVRPDLGDSIGDAFRNAGELLHELTIKETEENLRAVRILGYNSMEITEENIENVKAADQAVRTLINRLTGAVTVSLIREGVNPLETGVQELIDKISGMEDLSEENEKFSEYLFRLEQRDDIGEDEAESYIGIYRLIRQIEKSDGAVIGAVLNDGRELSLKNLLTELRIRKKGHMDYSIDDDFGGIVPKDSTGGNSKIDTQIMTAFRKDGGEKNKDNEGQENNGAPDGSERKDPVRYEENLLHEIYDRLDPISLKEAGGFSADTTLQELLYALRSGRRTDSGIEENYSAEQLEEIREAALKEDEVYETLLRYGIEITPENVNAMDILMNNRGMLFYNLMENIHGNMAEVLKKSSGKILDSMDKDSDGEDVSEEVREAYEEMAEQAGELINEASRRAGNYIDLKSLRNMNRQLTVASSLVKEENYEIPVEIEGRFTSVNLKVIRGTGESKASVSFESLRYGRVYGEFTLEKGKISGFATASGLDAAALKEAEEGFLNVLKDRGITGDDIIFEKSPGTDINRIPETADKRSVNHTGRIPSGKDGAENTEGKDAGNNTAVLYKTAAAFIRAVCRQ